MPRNIPGEPYTRVTALEAKEILDSQDAIVIDVRNKDEYEEGHVAGATWLPVEEVIARFDDLPTEGKLFFICQVGARSGLAAEYAAAMGADSDRLFNIEEGTPGWISAGLPHETGA
ncbi:MAG: rhodanese-like domain-containing protein [Chloroflexi bacterium]|nr:rhodanese-like domain-containing protein [Chloroflexota bacterium]